MDDTPQKNADAYSPSSTIITFDRPVPLLRGPVPAGPTDNPSAGPFVLAFKDSQSFASALKACESKLTAQCESGARIGCAIAASAKCKPPWWRSLFGGAKTDFVEREKCEERETAACFEAAKADCGKIGRDKCLSVFRDARIAVKERKVDWREAARLIFWASVAKRGLGFGLIELERVGDWVEFRERFEVTNYRGSDILSNVS
ncbi:hypothetical protein Acr_17g0003460 [Actinidia rufa]|uniref:Uncharacterized protein n=1 Tax=Actinidia rufa TaxID=165716 RepID=A0A7J0G1V6_9ERIC|nr:hypothetical protein Acr_17g0003460 [Actinidia rufa]